MVIFRQLLKLFIKRPHSLNPVCHFFRISEYFEQSEFEFFEFLLYLWNELDMVHLACEDELGAEANKGKSIQN